MSNINVTPAEVKELGTFCKSTSLDIDSLISKVQGQLGRTTWQSRAADAFRGDWEQHRTNLKAMQNQLEQLGQAAEVMGRNYEDADASYGGRG